MSIKHINVYVNAGNIFTTVSAALYLKVRKCHHFVYIYANLPLGQSVAVALRRAAEVWSRTGRECDGRIQFALETALVEHLHRPDNPALGCAGSLGAYLSFPILCPRCQWH